VRRLLRRGGPRPVRVLTRLIAAGLLVVSAACNQGPTTEDQRRLEALTTRLNGRYELRFEDPVYLRVRSLNASGPAVEDLREVFKAFWLDPSGVPRQDSNYVYLNAYDQAGVWKLQLSWDPSTKRVVEARDREHY